MTECSVCGQENCMSTYCQYEREEKNEGKYGWDIEED